MARPKKLSTVIRGGDWLESRIALRDHLAKALEEAPVGVKAQIAGQLRSVLDDIEAADVPEGSTLDDLAARRTARRRGSEPDTSASSAGG